MEQPIALHLASGATPATCAAIACALTVAGATRANRSLEIAGAVVALTGVAIFWVARASGIAALALTSDLQGLSLPSLASHRSAAVARS